MEYDEYCGTIMKLLGDFYKDEEVTVAQKLSMAIKLERSSMLGVPTTLGLILFSLVPPFSVAVLFLLLGVGKLYRHWKNRKGRER